MTDDVWLTVVAQVARMPGVPERLMSAHRADGQGLCVACTTPGRGTPMTPWPCGLFSLAKAAITVRKRLDTKDAGQAEPAPECTP